MKFYKALTVTGIGATILGLIVLTFQGTLYVAFGEWYSFSMLDILQRIGIRDYMYTGVDGFDHTVDMVLNFSLPITLIVFGTVFGLIFRKLWRREKEWYRPG